MADKPQLPPSLSSMRSAPAPDEDEFGRQTRERHNARVREEHEHRKKLRARTVNVTKAMNSLPLSSGANVSRFVPLFEQTCFDVERQERDRPNPARLAADQLADMHRKCVELASYLDEMSRDAIQEWSHAAGFAGAGGVAVWQMSRYLDEMAEIAARAYNGFKADPRSGAARGRPKDTLAKAMTETAAFVYRELTGKRINQSSKSGSFEEFLDKIFKAYKVEANLQRCIRDLRQSKFLEKIRI
jgi:hypothetical protein